MQQWGNNELFLWSPKNENLIDRFFWCMNVFCNCIIVYPYLNPLIGISKSLNEFQTDKDLRPRKSKLIFVFNLSSCAKSYFCILVWRKRISICIWMHPCFFSLGMWPNFSINLSCHSDHAVSLSLEYAVYLDLFHNVIA